MDVEDFMNNKEMITQYLKKYYGSDSSFREGQLEAIEAVLGSKRTLVVQKTGWGKSLVYFLATRILRDNHRGATIVISPLLSLMNNQIEAANKFNLNAVTINSNNEEDWKEIITDIINDKVDVLFISPERLGNKDFTNQVLSKMEKNIGLLVVDEAHCISDWGHDFRPDYRRIVRIVQSLPQNIPLLATTATANNRVVEDIKMQLGNDLTILRGELTRQSIAIDVIVLKDQAERLAWLYENINRLPGTGIIYCLTTADCDLVAGWLSRKRIKAESYYSSLGNDERIIREQKLINDEIKVLVASVALGMGFDKPNIGFVVHFQRPGNVVAYYQQIGRAGRNLESSYAILLCGQEDEEIVEYFINAAFPTQDEMQHVVEILERTDGLKVKQIQSYLDMKAGRIEKCLKFLEIEGVIYKEGSTYHRSLNPWTPNLEYAKAITKIRKYELQRMNDYIETDQCYMEFIAHELDDIGARACGKCSNCVDELLPRTIEPQNIAEAIQYIRSNYLTIEPRKQWPVGIFDKITMPQGQRMEEGLVLSMYGDAGWGKLVRDGKYRDGNFSDELVKASAELLKHRMEEWQIDVIVAIPSLNRPNLVSNFAKRLAKELGVEYQDIIYKKENTPQQKTFQNGFYQCQNAMRGFGLKNSIKGNILMVDDMVDSRWTFAYCAYLLKQGENYKDNKVYPFALAKTAGKE